MVTPQPNRGRDRSLETPEQSETTDFYMLDRLKSILDYVELDKSQKQQELSQIIVEKVVSELDDLAPAEKVEEKQVAHRSRRVLLDSANRKLAGTYIHSTTPPRKPKNP